MENVDLQAVAEAVLAKIFVPLEASGRHVHVTEQQAKILFGHSLTPKRPLSQPGQFLAEERVTVIGPKGKFDRVAVLGPERKESQVEVSLSDARVLGIDAPIRLSGDVKNTPGALLQTEKGQVALEQGVIVAQRHVHITPEDAAAMGVRDKQVVRLQVYTKRPLTFDQVQVRVSKDFATNVHLDYDEANACGFENGDLGRILP